MIFSNAVFSSFFYS